jgi:aldose 1-epimerase
MKRELFIKTKLFQELLLTLLIFLSSVGYSQKQTENSTIWKIPFGEAEGKTAYRFVLKNQSRMEATITNYGGIIISVKVPDRNGKFEDVVLGFDSLQSYINKHPYFGAIVGRYANRIGKAKFTLNGKEYKLAANNGENSLHGGVRGFDKAWWDVDEASSVPNRKLVLTYRSKDGEEGYPGNLQVRLTYALTDSNELSINYEATTDQPTVINLTSHPYFNLAGAGNGDILSHEMMINADRFTPVNENLIPTGELLDVSSTPMDFRTSTRIGARIDQQFQQLLFGGGYDQNWVLNKSGNELALAARVSENLTGRVMEVWTTQPGLQFYTGNSLDGTNIGKGGKIYQYRSGLCLETQHYPDSPNKQNFPTTVLNPGEKFISQTIYKFSVK